MQSRESEVLAFCHLLHTSNVYCIGSVQFCILTIEGLYRICAVPQGDHQGERTVFGRKSSGKWLSDQTCLVLSILTWALSVLGSVKTWKDACTILDYIIGFH